MTHILHECARAKVIVVLPLQPRSEPGCCCKGFDGLNQTSSHCMTCAVQYHILVGNFLWMHPRAKSPLGNLPLVLLYKLNLDAVLLAGLLESRLEPQKLP